MIPFKTLTANWPTDANETWWQNCDNDDNVDDVDDKQEEEEEDDDDDVDGDSSNDDDDDDDQCCRSTLPDNPGDFRFWTVSPGLQIRVWNLPHILRSLQFGCRLDFPTINF